MFPHYWPNPYFIYNPAFDPSYLQSIHLYHPQLPSQVISRPPSPTQHEKQIEKPEKIQITREDLEKQTFNSSKKTWTQEQDLKLCQLIQKDGLSWNDVSKNMDKRTYKMCYSRYRRIQQAAKEAWTSQEDKTISNYVTIFGKSWKKISSQMPKRTPKQIRERYINFIRPNISKDDWKIQEDLKLVNLINTYGRKWKKIEEQLVVRTQNQIKNRFFNRILKVWRKKTQNRQEI